MGKRYSDEITELPSAIEWAVTRPIAELERAISALGDLNLYAVGSGGSFTAAAFAASLHESTFGRLSRAVTPLEALCLSSSLSNCAALLLSAEGKNKDILAAAQELGALCAEGVAVTLTKDNPLSSFCNKNGRIYSSAFDMPWGKDGYLATNSLVATMVLIARAYLPRTSSSSFSSLSAEWLQDRRKWYEGQAGIRSLSVGLRPVVLYGRVGRIAALDLESKFTESGFGNCQIADYRQFAHGRHLQLAGEKPPVIVSFGSKHDSKLIDLTLRLVPGDVQIIRIPLPDDPSSAEITGVIETMLLVETLANNRGVDVGQPTVAQFGRDMYGMDVRELVVKPLHERPSSVSNALLKKVPPRGPPSHGMGDWRVAGVSFYEKLRSATVKAVVLDFDGTCCETAMRFAGLDERLIEDISRLANSDVKIAFATGRGTSLQTDLRKKIDPDIWRNVYIGYYSGAAILRLDDDLQRPEGDPRLSCLVDWLYLHCIVLDRDATDIRGGQLGISAAQNTVRNGLVRAARHWIEVNGYRGWRVFCSGHSVDILTENVGKRKVIEFISNSASADKSNEILCIGDSGQLEGNDYELLAEGLGLSVANVSPSMSGCWNLLPKGMKGVAGTKRYLAGLIVADGLVRFSDSYLSAIKADFFSSSEAT
jgi:hydroxymethylpyrimidine pyrophosphatase-like HAD family hydrolase/fructoselysine-6-P-deglycase FrlB-like protein